MLFNELFDSGHASCAQVLTKLLEQVSEEVSPQAPARSRLQQALAVYLAPRLSQRPRSSELLCLQSSPVSYAAVIFDSHQDPVPPALLNFLHATNPGRDHTD